MKDIFFSGTFGGETLSLAASKAVLEKIKRDNVIEYLSELGEYLHKEFFGLELFETEASSSMSS